MAREGRAGAGRGPGGGRREAERRGLWPARAGGRCGRRGPVGAVAGAGRWALWPARAGGRCGRRGPAGAMAGTGRWRARAAGGPAPPVATLSPPAKLMDQTDGVVTIDDVRALASGLPRSYEAIVADRVKFRVGRIVYLAFSRDETVMGFGFPKEERELLVSSEPDKFKMPSASDMRYHWVHVWLNAIDETEMRELVLDAWQMVVPKKVAAEYLQQHPPRPGRK